MPETDEKDTANNSAVGHLDGYDIGVIVTYFVIILAIGLWSSRRSKKENADLSGYFLASRKMTWIPVGASVFSSNISSASFIGLAGSAAATGIGVAGYELGALYILMLLGYIFVPVYISSEIYTVPEYLRERFGGQRIRVYIALLSLLLSVFTKISGDLYAGALFIQLAINKPSPEWLYISIILLLGMSALFTIAGGLTAVIWTDSVQTILIVVGGLILMGKAFDKIGGFDNLVNEFPYAIAEHRAGNGTCGIPPDDYMNLLRSPTPGESDLPWTGMVFGLSIMAIWYFCTDQVIVQRTLASKNIVHAKGGCIFAAYLKILPLFIMVFPGMIARILYPDRVGCSDPKECFAICQSKYGCTNIAYVELVVKLLPSGLTGLMFAVMIAALVSSLTSVFNSASTIFSIDIWTRMRSKASDWELLVIGRLFVVLLGIISILWIPVIQNAKNAKLFEYFQSVTSFLSPPICAIFLLAIFWERTTEPGAFYGLMVGLVIGVFRFILEFSFPPPICGTGPDTRHQIIKNLVDKVHYLHFSCLLFLMTLCVAVGVSYLTPPIPEECLYRLTYWRRHHTQVRVPIDDVRYDENNRRIDGTAEPENELFEDGEGSSALILLSRICNIMKSTSVVNKTPQEPTEDEAILSEENKAKKAVEFLEEDRFWGIFTDINAVICVSVCVFLWGFFA